MDINFVFDTRPPLLIDVCQETIENELLPQEQVKEEYIPVYPDSLLDWTADRRAMLAEGKPFNLSEHKYLEAIYKDKSKELVICKAGQVGVSEYLISYVIWSADDRGANGLYVFPTVTHVNEFSATRVGPALDPDLSEYIAQITHAGTKDKIDKASLKRVRSNYIFFRGAGVRIDGKAPQLRSIDVDVLVLDEYDEMPKQAPALARERLGHSKIAEARIASTPSYHKQGIYPLYLESTMHTWIVKCHHCGKRQDLSINDLVMEWDELERPAKWHKDKHGPYLACRNCGKKLDNLSPGEWVAKYPKRQVTGYHLSRLFTPHRSLQELIDKLSKPEEHERKEAWNQGLGLPFKSSSAISLSDTTLDSCKRSYSIGKVSTGITRVYAGIDVGNVLHLVIRGDNKYGNSLLLYAAQVREFEELPYLLNKYGVEFCVIDALPETRKAREFQALMPEGMIWLCYYIEIDKHAPSEMWFPDPQKNHVNADRTRTLDKTFAGFFTAAKGEIGNTLPRNIQSVTDYYRQMCALERVIETKRDGKQVAVYVGGDDHYAHAENYASIAGRCIMFGSWSRGPAGK